MSASIRPARPDHRTLTSATADALREAISSGQFAPGSQLPSEFELMEMLGVSRSTLREALRVLEQQQYIVRRRGLGTYVSEPSILKDLSVNFGITEMIRQAGLKPGSSESAVRQISVRPEVAEALQVKKGTPVVVIDRVRTANGRPVVWSLDYLPAALLDQHAISLTDLQSQSLYSFLEEHFAIRITHGVARIRPVAASVEMAARLHVPKGAPLLCLAQTDFDLDERPVLHSVEYHLPDAFVFLVNRRGPHW